MNHRTAPLTVLASLLAAGLYAQTPVGDPIEVTPSGAPLEAHPGVASADDGRFVVVWDDTVVDGNGVGVLARNFGADGVPAAAPAFQVNSITSGRQSRPSVAADAAGNVVVVWSDQDDGSGSGIIGRLFDAAGAPRTGEFIVNSFTTGMQDHPVVTADAAGNFVVAWESVGQDGSDSAIALRRFDPAGTAVGDDVIVNSFTTGEQQRPAIASDVAGNVVVVWQSAAVDGDGFGIRGRLFDPAGAPVSEELAVSAFTTGNQTLPTVAASDAGDFVVAWDDEGRDGAGRGVFARRFDASGTATGDDFPLATAAEGDQTAPAAAANAAGDVVIVWQTTGAGIFGRRVAPDGAPLGDPFEISTGALLAPSVSSATEGRFVVVWQNGTAILGRVFDR